MSLADSGAPTRAERWTAVLLLLGYSGVYLESVKAHFAVRFSERLPEAPLWAEHLTTALQALTLGVTALLCLARPLPVARRLWKDRALLALLALAAGSALWSHDPAQCLAASLRLGGAACLSAYLVERFGPRDQLSLFRTVWLVLAIASAAIALATPFGVMTDQAHDGAWRGAFATRNQLGAIAGIGVLVFLAPGASPRHGLVSAVGAASCGALLLLSGSRGGIVALVLAGAAIAVAHVGSRAWRVARPRLAVGLLAAVTVVLLVLPPLTRALGGESSLQMRADIWTLTSRCIGEAPWLGHGYATFWTSAAATEIRRSLVAGVEEAHNGFVQLWLELGATAVALMLVHYGRALRAGLRAPLDRLGAAWAVGLLTFWGARNLVEVSALVAYGADGLVWILYLTTALSLAARTHSAAGAAARAPKLALVCSSGGHFFELYSLRASWEGPGLEHFWVTFPGSDTDCLLARERTYAAYHPTNRNLTNLVRNLLLALRVLLRERPSVIVSTGAGVAVPFLWLGRLLGARTIYIESITWIHTLSLSGRLVAPFVHELLVQWPQLAATRTKATFVGRCV
jgi:beta-1,4-N-acetylglucosaminyltransferase